MAIRIVRPTLGRHQVVEFLQKVRAPSVVAFVHEQDGEHIWESTLLLDFDPSGEVHVVALRATIDAMEGPYFIWTGSRQNLVEGVVKMTDTFGHIAVRVFVSRNSTGNFGNLKDALKDARFSEIPEVSNIRAAWSGKKKPRYIPADDPNQSKLF